MNASAAWERESVESESGKAAGQPQRVIYEATLERIVERAPDTRSLFLRLPDPQHLAFRPGQFISCMLPIGGETLIRPYSIASDPEDGALLEICLNLVPGGPGSHHLFGLGAGAALRFTGPWGTFTLDSQPDAECVFIAEGTGVAPIRPMLKRVLARPSGHAVRLHYAARSTPHLLYANELAAAERACSQFTFTPLPGVALTEYVAQRYVTGDNDRSRHFYICGVGEIVPQLRDLLRRAGYQRRAVQYEKW